MSVLSDVPPKARNAFELQALVVFGLMHDEGGLMVRELGVEGALVDVAVRRLREVCGRNGSLLRAWRGTVGVVERVKENLGKSERSTGE